MKTLLVALLLLLAGTGTAFAECAWVLWKESFYWPSGLENWNLYEAYESKKECDAEKATYIQIALKRAGPPGTRRELKGGVILMLDSETSKELRREEFHCFPSGTDPRPRYKE